MMKEGRVAKFEWQKTNDSAGFVLYTQDYSKDTHTQCINNQYTRLY